MLFFKRKKKQAPESIQIEDDCEIVGNTAEMMQKIQESFASSFVEAFYSDDVSLDSLDDEEKTHAARAGMAIWLILSRGFHVESVEEIEQFVYSTTKEEELPQQ